MSENYKTERNFILRLKQNTNIITSGLEDAKIALKTQMRTLEDKGQLIVCFYKGSEDDTTVRVIGGITGSETLFVNDYEVTKDLTDTIIALKDGVSEDFDTLKKIEDYINSLDFTSAAVDGQYISEFEQENGQIKGLKRVNLSDAPINGYKKGTRMPDDDLSIKPTDDIKTGFSKLEKQVDKHTEDVNTRFENLKYNDYTRKGNTIIKTVTQKDGLINVTEEELKAETVTTPNIVGTTSTIAVTGDTVKDQIADIAKTIKTNENSAEHYRIVEATDEEKNTLGANIYTAYKLMCWANSEGSSDVNEIPNTAVQKGDWILIEKDKFLESVRLDRDNQKIIFTYVVADGSKNVVELDIKSILFDYEYDYPIYVATDGKIKLNIGDGLENKTDKLYVKIDAASENFLTLSNEGLKVSGVQTAINSAVNGLDSDISSTNINNDNTTTGHVKVRVVETDGKLTSVIVTENNIANKTDLDSEIAARKAVDGPSGQTYSSNTSTNYIKTATSLNDADIKLEAEIKAINYWDVIDGGTF